ncbi:hypothetical protein HETIRDRAFT_453062 [Heterobasidion irregulare TC 32-1]|uniref:Uncharacterized protein n=1 Tax=Heterobasidion irregulare (strain TC 32-1) TaxID=747525 RepID=W4K4T4_HETIT|nr:uncharacterized protein HETIRDRAFT_453062 [Heterobasidion irregulare TC 32-1]ETW80071.1 hypothetical protein HETIRDRAFT_453062 [Heterobasidion irregulare TC 32-1]
MMSGDNYLDATLDWNLNAIAYGSDTDSWKMASDMTQYTAAMPSPDDPRGFGRLLDKVTQRDAEELLRYASQEPQARELYLPPSPCNPSPSDTCHLSNNRRSSYSHMPPAPLDPHRSTPGPPSGHTSRPSYLATPPPMWTPPPDLLPMHPEIVNTRHAEPCLQPSFEPLSQPWAYLHVPPVVDTESHWTPFVSTGIQPSTPSFVVPAFSNTPSSGPSSPPTWCAPGLYSHPSLAIPMQMPTPDVSAAGPSRVRRLHQRPHPYHRDDVNYASPASFPGFIVAGAHSQVLEPPVAGPSRPHQPRNRHLSPPAPSLPPQSPYPPNPHLPYPSPPFSTPSPLVPPPSPAPALALNKAQKRKRQSGESEDQDEVQRPRRKKRGPSVPEQSSATFQVGCAPHRVQPPQQLKFANDEPEDDLQPHAAPKRVNRGVAGPLKASTSSKPKPKPKPKPKREQSKGKAQAAKQHLCPIAGCPFHFTSRCDMKRHVGTASVHQDFRDSDEWPAFKKGYGLRRCHLNHCCGICDIERNLPMRWDALIRHRKTESHLDKANKAAAGGQGAQR